MTEVTTEKPVTAIRHADYVCSTWFERDRRHVRLERPDGTEVFALWDDDVTQAIEDDYLSTPRVPRASDSDWQPHAVAYAIEYGLIDAEDGCASARCN